MSVTQATQACAAVSQRWPIVQPSSLRHPATQRLVAPSQCWAGMQVSSVVTHCTQRPVAVSHTVRPSSFPAQSLFCVQRAEGTSAGPVSAGPASVVPVSTGAPVSAPRSIGVSIGAGVSTAMPVSTAAPVSTAVPVSAGPASVGPPTTELSPQAAPRAATAARESQRKEEGRRIPRSILCRAPNAGRRGTSRAMTAAGVVQAARCATPSAMKLLTRWVVVCALAGSSVLACQNRPAPPAATTTAAATPAATPPAAANVERLPLRPDVSTIGFVGRKITASHDGRFAQFSGTIELDPARVENSRVTVEIQMASVQIEPPRLRGHLLSPDLFNVAQFPTATFTSTAIQAGGADGASHTLTGNLTLHGVTRAITFPARVSVGPRAVSTTAEFSINRREFGIVYPGMPDDLIQDAVTIRLNLTAPRGS